MADSKKTTAPSLEFTRSEWTIINNALNEVCNGLSFDDDEFETRVGYPREAAQKVLAKIAKALKK